MPAEQVPGADDGATQARRALLRRAVALFLPYRRRLGVIAVLIVISAGLGVVTPFLTQAVFDRALFVEGGPRLGLLGWLVGGMVVIALISAALGVWQTYVTQRVGNAVMRDLRDRMFAHLQRMELAFFTGTRTGEIQSRLDNDVAGVQRVVTDTGSTILQNTVTVLSALIAMIALSWRLTLVALVLLPVFVVLQARVGRLRRAVAQQTQSSLADMTSITQEALSVSGVLLSKVFGRQATESARFQQENDRQADLQVRQVMTGQSFFATVQAFFGLTPALVYLVAGFTLAGTLGGAAGTLTSGTVVAFTTLQSRLLFPIVNLLRVSVDVSTSLALFGRVFEYLDLVPAITEVEEPVALDAEGPRGHVRFDDVWFRYPPPLQSERRMDEGSPDGGSPEGGSPEGGSPQVSGDGTGPASSPSSAATAAWTLRGIDLNVKPGSLAAFVGPSGAGKTTASYLVPRLYDAVQGSVSIDDVDVRDATFASLARLIGVVTQESYLFHATIRENLRYARDDATDAEIEEAAQAAHIADRIHRFPEGYDTMVGERGYRLSGGEKQRLAIARVVLADPRILILDEATSALDTESERLVQRALEPLMAERTTIAIAHRLSTILAADVIYVFDDGAIVESGTHAELLARDGLYARLYVEQFGDGKVEARCADGVRFRSGDVLHHRPDARDPASAVAA